jgi:hypothetical protein
MFKNCLFYCSKKNTRYFVHMCVSKMTALLLDFQEHYNCKDINVSGVRYVTSVHPTVHYVNVQSVYSFLSNVIY